MQQLRLVWNSGLVQKSVTHWHIKALFTAVAEQMHEVVLEVNSHKFFINMKAWLKRLEQFEVIAVQGCVEVCVKVVRLLKRVVSTLYFEQ